MFKKGNIPWNKNKKGIMPIPWNKNKKGIFKHTKETKEKIRITKKGKKPYEITDITKGKMREAQKKKYTKFPELKKQIAEKLKGNTHGFQKGQKRLESAYSFPKGNKVRLGIKHTKETKNKIGRKKEKHWNWKGGKSFEPYSLDWTETLRRSIRERDNYICQLCDKQQGDIAHDIHHIDYDKQNCNPSNLITLCHSCNAKVNYKREYWTNFFQQKIWQH